MKKYIVYAPAYDQNSGGSVALHKLSRILNEVGAQSYLYPMIPSFELSHRNIEEVGIYIRNIYDSANLGGYAINPEISSTVLNPHPKFVVPDDCVVVYPEVVFGNPLQARHVVRWLLHNPGYHTGKIYYGPGELYFRYGDHFGDFQFPGSRTSRHFLRISHIPFDLYYVPPEQDHQPRSGVAYCIRKGARRAIAEDMRGATLIDGKNHEEVAKIMKSVKTFVSYDTHTLYSRLAAIAGCDSVVVPEEGVSREQWFPNVVDRYGMAYGFGDLDFARRTRRQLAEELRAEEVRARQAVRDFVQEIETYFP